MIESYINSGICPSCGGDWLDHVFGDVYKCRYCGAYLDPDEDIHESMEKIPKKRPKYKPDDEDE